MPNIKAVVIRRPTNSITGMTHRIMTTPKRLNVVQEGLRASDNMTMILSAEHDVQQNDEIYRLRNFSAIAKVPSLHRASTTDFRTMRASDFLTWASRATNLFLMFW